MTNSNLKPIDVDLKREGLTILFQVLIANLILSISSNIAFLLLSEIPWSQKIDGFTPSFIAQLLLIIWVLVLRYVIPEKFSDDKAMAFTAYISYVFFSLYYFNFDIAPIVIMMALSYMLAVQIMAKPLYTLAFGLTGVFFALFLFIFRDNTPFDIGIGFTSALIQALIAGLYASLRYVRLIITYRNRMTEQVEQLLESEKRSEILRRASREIMWDYDLKQRKRNFTNVPLNDENQYLSSSSTLEDWVLDLHPDDQEPMLKQLKALAAGTIDYFEKEFRQISTSGKETWFAARAVNLKNPEGTVDRIAGTYTYIHDRKVKELQLEYLAFYDDLTELPNRSSFAKDVDHHITKQPASPITLFYIDIADFKEFNSSFGHLSGDQLLKAIAKRLVQQFKENVKVYQITTADLGLVYYGDLSEPAIIAQAILDRFKEPFSIDGKEVYTSVKIGIANYPESSREADALLRSADTALYHCQKHGQSPYLVYNADMTDSVVYRLSLNKHMRQAVENREFYLVYQPIMRVDGQDNVLDSFEALVRWNSPQLGFVSPDQFISYAEETGLIHAIGRQVIEDSLSFIKKALPINDKVRVSINLSAKQIESEYFLPELLAIIKESGVPHSNVGFEITETSFMENFDSAQYKLHYLREQGFKISLDDFGTGYSSLNYLGQLEIDTLKIDKSFTQKINTAANDYYLIKSVISLAKDLNITFVAEGVETGAQLTALKEIGCPLVQGYYFSKPLSESDALKQITLSGLEN